MKESDNITQIDFNGPAGTFDEVTLDLNRAMVLDIRRHQIDDSAGLRVLPVPIRRKLSAKEKKYIFWDVMVYGRSFMPYRLFKMLIFWWTNRLYPSQAVIKRLPTNSGKNTVTVDSHLMDASTVRTLHRIAEALQSPDLLS